MLTLPPGVALAWWGAPDRQRKFEAAKSLGDAWRELGGNVAFRRLLSAWFVNGLANGAPVSLFLFFVAHQL